MAFQISDLKAQNSFILSRLFGNAVGWAGAQTTNTIKTSQRTGVKKYSTLYIFTEVDGPRAARNARRA